MKYILSLVILSSTILALDVDGVWKEVSTDKHRESVIVMARDGDTIRVTCCWYKDNLKVVWYGIGKVNNEQIRYEIVHTTAPSDFDKRGVHDLKLDDNGMRMTGTWTNSRMESGKLEFVRVK